MARVTIVIGVLLIALGLVAYFVLAEADAEGKKSMTALIPAFFGAPILLLGLVALKDAARKHAMHGAVALALFGLAGALTRPVGAMVGGTFDLSAATGVQLLMGALCAVFVFLCVRSFINARRASGGA